MIRCLLILGLFVSPLSLAWGQDPPSERDPKRPCRVQWQKRVKINYRQRDLLDMVKEISELTCTNFIISSMITGRTRKITIVSENPISIRDLWQAFLATLELIEISAIKQGGYYKLVFAREAGRKAIPFHKKAPALGDEIITYLLQLKYVDAAKVQNVIRTFLSPIGQMIPFQNSGTFVLIDYAPSIQRLVKIAKELDIPEAEARDRMFILQVENGQAQEIVARIQAIFQVVAPQQASQRAPNTPPIDEDYRISKILADERTNRIIVVCGNRAYLHLKALLVKLDISLPNGGTVRVTRLEFAKAEEIAQTLSQLAQGRAPARPSAAIQSTDLFQGEIRITPDKGTNSLVIVASQRDYERLMRVIRALDVRRKQVFVETVILEVSLDKSRELGVAFHGGVPFGDPTKPDIALLGTRLAGLNSIVLDPAALMGLALGLRGPEIPNSAGLLGAGGIPAFGVVLRAIQANSDVEIISTPHILTATNEEALLQVGQNVPFVAGTNFSSIGVGVGFPVQNIQRQDVALTLKIKPQLNAGDQIKMKIDIELTEIATQDRELGPTTTKRKIDTTVQIKDSQTVVIGGLMRDQVSNSTSKVPILGDIPLLGTLFRSSSRIVEKRNLLVFMTPHIVLRTADFRRIFKQKMEERKQFLEYFYSRKFKDSRSALRSSGHLDRLLHRPPPTPPSTP